MFEKRALIVGVTGIVGLNVAEHLLALGDWAIAGVSRRPSLGLSGVTPITLDVLDAQACRAALGDHDPTHIFFCTWTRGTTEAENIRLNGAMLRNVLDAVPGGRSLRHVAVVTGTKHYLGPFDNYAKNKPVTPFREEQARLPIDNFYYALEDIVMEAAGRRGFSWSVHRSHTIIGYAVGNLMNIGATLAAFATFCRKTGAPFLFPGHPTQYHGLTDITDARLLARHIVWASTAPDARNEAFNVVNGDTFRWNRMWSVIARYFGLEPADYPERAVPLEGQMQDAAPIWDSIVRENGLQPIPLGVLASPWHTDLDLGRPMECLNSMAKSRRLGFRDYQDSEQSFVDVFDRLRRERIIP
jgi:nucleoside-diphosphate-sugar epimerase